MKSDTKKRLNELKKLNHYKIAKRQLIEALNKHHNINIEDYNFSDSVIAQSLYRQVYEKLRQNELLNINLQYERESVQNVVNEIFENNVELWNRKVVFYPALHDYFLRQRYHTDYNIAIAIEVEFHECKPVIDKLLHEVHNDMVIVDSDMRFGLIINENEYEEVDFDFWGLD